MKALTGENAQFDFRHIQAASVLWSMHKLKSVPERLCCFWRICLIKRPRFVRVQIIHYQDNFIRNTILFGNVPEK
jgi:hypothetical protein